MDDRRTFTIDQLELSPFNVRTNIEDQQPTEPLERSLLTFGLINPLRVHPMRGTSGKRARWGVHAGGRRYRAIKALIARGDLPADWPIECHVREAASDAALIEESAAENLLRRELRDYEIAAGVVRAHRKGDDVATIAAMLGQRPIWVERMLRLGRLAEPIFKAFAAGELSLDQARAFAATEDQACQLEAWAAFGQAPTWQRTPATIRNLLRVDDVELNRLLAFVGADAYRAAGGRFELDLFADDAEARGRVADEGVLRTLVHEALEDFRAATRRRAGRADLRFVAQPPQSEFGSNDWHLQVTPREVDGGEAIELPEGDIVAHVAIDAGGEPALTFWWESRAAKFGRTSAAPAPANDRRPIEGAAIGNHAASEVPLANRIAREEQGLTGDAIQILRSIRRELVRAALIDQARATGWGDLARDYLIWAQLRIALTHASSAAIGAKGLVDGWRDSAPPGLAEPHLEASGAHAIWTEALREIADADFMRERDPVVAFGCYLEAEEEVRALAAAVLAGLALERSANLDGYRIPLHDALIAETGRDPAFAREHWWTPSESFLRLLPKNAALALADGLAPRDELAAMARLKADQLYPQLTAILAADPEWLHPALRFAAWSEPAEAELQEAAE